LSRRRAVAEPILLVAVSARMLAELAVRAGHDVVALDRFGDRDLRALCPTFSAPTMADLVDAATGVPAPSVIYGAGLENRPDLVARLEAGRELLGCGPSVLERVRDPAVLGASLRRAGLAYPRTYGPGDAPEPVGRWLRKPLRGGGGRGVREWRGGALPADAVVQERIAGVSCSVAAVADGRAATVLGVTEQLVGRPELGARGFAWCGNVTVADPRRARAAEAICAHLAADFGLVGLFGVDFVWDGERAWVVEVNPRPTGSLELFDAPVVDIHLEACAGRLPATIAPGVPTGKAIVYAREDTRIGDTGEWRERGIRDVPHPGEHIAAGHPICTLLATGPTPEAVVAELDDRAAALRAELRVHAVA
jgi:predicted ATP-grasp superfamily ATP-dependent carboligase